MFRYDLKRLKRPTVNVIYLLPRGELFVTSGKGVGANKTQAQKAIRRSFLAIKADIKDKKKGDEEKKASLRPGEAG